MMLVISRPGKSTDNCFIETFNGSLRDECLNVHWFELMEEAKVKIEDWRRDYNETRPHQALGDRTPVEVAIRLREIDEHSNRRKLTLRVLRRTQAAHCSPCRARKHGIRQSVLRTAQKGGHDES